MHSEFVIRKALYRAGSFVYNENLFKRVACSGEAHAGALLMYEASMYSVTREKKG